MLRVGFHPEAEKELEEAALYYESQEPGLGLRFLENFESGYRQVHRSPATWRRLRGDIHRFLLKGFPYGIIYSSDGDNLFILAVMHLKREPDYWLGRISEIPGFSPSE